MVDYARDLAAAAGLRDPEKLARDIVLLQEGAIVVAHVMGDLAAATRAREIARTLIDAQSED